MCPCHLTTDYFTLWTGTVQSYNTPSGTAQPTCPPVTTLQMHNKLMALSDKYNTLVLKGYTSPPPGQTQSRSFSGLKCLSSPKPGPQDQVYKWPQSFLHSQIGSILLAVYTICIGRHCHDIACCNSPHTWDQKQDTYTEHFRGNLWIR